MSSKQCSKGQHVVAVICVIVLAVLIHGAMSLTGVGGPSLAMADAVHDEHIALPGTLR